MRRRDAVCTLLAVATFGGTWRARAQVNHAKPFRIATFPDFISPATRDWFIDAMRELGWMEDRDFVIVSSGFQLDEPEVNEAAIRVVAGKPDLVVTYATSNALALHRATSSIPIVAISFGYPVEAGVANSLARPGKNVTGNSFYAGTEIWGKLLELLHEVKPSTKRLSVLWTYVPPLFPREEIEPCYAELRNAARSLGLTLHIVEAATSDQVAGALTEIDAQQPDALLIAGGLAGKLRPTIMEFAVERRLPTITDGVWLIEIQPYHPLLGYGAQWPELTRIAVNYVDRILKGAKPGDLPIQQPSRFELAVNLKTARAIGLTMPPSLLARADKVMD
jgi:putative ABC transport system substrate-binding protein